MEDNRMASLTNPVAKLTSLFVNGLDLMQLID